MKSRDEIFNLAEQSGLNPKLAWQHYQRFWDSRKDCFSASIPIADTCRLENGGILPIGWMSERISQHKANQGLSPKGVVSFIPAAGASTRYYKAFSELIAWWRSGCEKDQSEPLRSLLTDLKKMPLPPALRAYVELPIEEMRHHSKMRDAAMDALHMPKGLQPCNREGDCYFFVQHRLNQLLADFTGEVFVVSPQHRRQFQEQVRQWCSQFGTDGDVKIFDQGADLSTFRITSDGEPLLVKNQLSLVPAGHGALIHLIPSVKQHWPDARAILIRNVDNLFSNSEETQWSVSNFLWTFDFILDRVKRIRRALVENRMPDAAEIAQELIAQDSAVEGAENQDFRVLWTVQQKLFHAVETTQAAPQNKADQLELLRQLYEKPVNVLGQVPNILNDVGGTPVFVKSNSGLNKVCLEVPHACEQDRQEFLANPEKATHFNPVFVASEVVENASPYLSANHPYWLIADKVHQNNPVHYHETVLYELLGNSHFANVVFIEIPRSLFDPHKALSDAQFNTRKSAGIDGL